MKLYLFLSVSVSLRECEAVINDPLYGVCSNLRNLHENFKVNYVKAENSAQQPPLLCLYY